MADNIIEHPVEEQTLNQDLTAGVAAETVQPEPAAIAPAAGKKKSKILIAGFAALLILAILAGGGFLGIRLYENQSLTQAKNALQQGDWASAEAAADQALALQQTGLLVDPGELVRVRGEARYQQKKYDLATADLNVVKAAHPWEAALYLYQAKMLYDQGKFDEAVQMGVEALEYDNNLAFPYVLQAYQEYKNNHLVDALNYAAAAIQRDPQEELAYRVRGSVLTWQYDLDAAQADLERAAALKPGQPETLAMQAFIHFLRHEEKQLETAVKAVMETGQGTAPALWAQAMLSLTEHDEDAALKYMDQAIKLDGTRPEYYTLRTFCYYKTDQEKQALADLDKALELNPDFVLAIATKAGYLFSSYEKVDMEAEANRVLALAPIANMPHLMLADKYARERDWTKALDAVEKALKAQPGPSGALLARAAIYLDQHAYDKAAADYQQVTQNAPQNIGGLLGLAHVQMAQGSFEEAHKTLDQAAQIDPDSMEVHSARALVYLSDESRTKARKEVEEALKRDPGNSNVLTARAWVSLQDDNQLSALSDVNRLGELYPQDPRVMVLRATVLAANKDDKAAITELSKAEKIDNKLVDIYVTRAMIYLGQDDMTRTIAQAKKAVELDPKNSQALSLLGQAEILKEKTEDGIGHLQQSLEFDPSQRHVYFFLGMAQWELGSIEEARENLKKMMGMRGKLDTSMVAQASDAVEFLEKVPPSLDGVRTVEDKFEHFSISYPTTWFPQPPVGGVGTQFTLTHPGSKKDPVFEVQVIKMVDLDIQSALSPEDISRATMQMLAEMCYGFKPVAHGPFEGNGVKGVTDIFECTLQNENYSFYTIRQKLYIFTSDKSYVVLHYVSSPEKFTKDLDAADEIAASFRFTK